MGLADEVRAMGVEEACISVIEGDRNVAADVFVGNDLACVECDETFARNSFLPEMAMGNVTALHKVVPKVF